VDESQAFEAMAQALSERGLMAPEVIAQDRAALTARLNGEPPPAETPQSGGPVPSQDGADSQMGQSGAVGADPLDALAFQGAKSPAEYNFGTAPQGVEISLEQEQAFRAIFHENEIPPAIGSEIGKLWNKAVLNPPDPQQLDRMYQDGHAALSRVWGADLQKNLAAANGEVNRMAKSHPEIKAMLAYSGLGNNAWLAQTLFHLSKARGRA